MAAATPDTTIAWYEMLSTVFSTLGTVVGGLLVYLRNKDKKESGVTLEKIAADLEVLTNRYAKSVDKAQAEKLIDSFYQNFESTLHCWMCDYVTGGRPPMTEGSWNLETVIDSGYLLIKKRLSVFNYKEEAMGDWVEEKPFKALLRTITRSIHTFETTKGLGKYVTDQVNMTKSEVTKKLK